MEKAWASLGALFAFLGFLQGLIHTFLPPDLSRACRRLGVSLCDALFSAYVDYTVDEYDGAKRNELYAAVQLHLSDKAATHARRLSLSQLKNASAITCTLCEQERILDSFEGSQIWWEFRSLHERRNNLTFSWDAVPDQRRSLHMRIRRGDREKIMSSYLPHLLANAKALKLKRRDRLLYTNVSDRRYSARDGGRTSWDSVPFSHPATFRSIALEPALKQKIIEDLTDFINGEQFYKDVGRAWKRGYLLYGPPGTGKSSLIAAMANFLEYDVYDLELTQVKSNASLRSLLLNTSNKAVVVIEDIDCSLDLSQRKKKKKNEKTDAESAGIAPPQSDAEKGSEVTLSGLLNFTDGLWSSCGSERLFVFTTNHIEKIDAALLRSGRMDMHINLTYCGYEAFRVLARNYLKLEEHALFEEVRAAMQEENAHITPADVSEVMTREKRNPEHALRCLIEKLRQSKLKKLRDPVVEDEDEEEEAQEKVTVKAGDEASRKADGGEATIEEDERQGIKKSVSSVEAEAQQEGDAKEEDMEGTGVEEEQKQGEIKEELGDAKAGKDRAKLEEDAVVGTVTAGK